MEPFSIKKYLRGHRIIILEGFWGAGKSTVAHYLRDKIIGTIIPEPVYHNPNALRSDLSAWYIVRHERRLQEAFSMLKRGRRSVICERSILSSAAFEYASKGRLSEIMKKRIRRISSRRLTTIVYLKPTRALITKGIARLRDVSVLHQLQEKPHFVSDYHKFFYKILPRDFNVRGLYYLNTSASFLKHLLKKAHEVSSAGVVIYGNKVVVLYDKKYKHFVLPQGHIKAGESFIQTAKREIIEETGYIDLIYLKKLYSYRYHFSRANQTVFKSIHVYLFKLQTTKRGQQVLETHEMYDVRLIPMRSAIAMLHWPQDRLVVKKVIQEIKGLQFVELKPVVKQF